MYLSADVLENSGNFQTLDTRKYNISIFNNLDSSLIDISKLTIMIIIFYCTDFFVCLKNIQLY